MFSALVCAHVHTCEATSFTLLYFYFPFLTSLLVLLYQNTCVVYTLPVYFTLSTSLLVFPDRPLSLVPVQCRTARTLYVFAVRVRLRVRTCRYMYVRGRTYVCTLVDYRAVLPANARNGKISFQLLWSSFMFIDIIAAIVWLIVHIFKDGTHTLPYVQFLRHLKIPAKTTEEMECPCHWGEPETLRGEVKYCARTNQQLLLLSQLVNLLSQHNERNGV